MRVALVNPPYFPRFSRSQRSPGVIKSGTMYYPYWLAHATAVLLEDGFDCLLLDCPAADMTLARLIETLRGFAPDLCILETSTASYRNDIRVAETIRRNLPNAKLCFTGTHATATWEAALADCPSLDYVAIGEYDYIVRDLARALKAKEPVAAIPALGSRLPGGAPVRGPMRTVIENVDALPWIAPIYKRFLQTPHYYFSLASHPMVMLIGGRGCVAKCTYCVYPQVMHGHRYRTRSPESIVGEMKWIQENMPEVREIVFEDDTFTGDKAFARRVAELVRERGVTLPWFANVRCSIDGETLALLQQAGFRCCAVGFESGDDTLLKNMWKGQTVATQLRFVEDCRALGILVHGCFMVGFPGETRETMEKTLQLALRLSPDSAQFYPVMPFPGTSYYIWAKENGYLATDDFEAWLNDEGGHRCVLNLPGLPAREIELFCERAYRRFYFRPRYFWYKIRQAFREPREGVRSVGAFFSYLWYLAVNRRHRTPAFPAVPLPEATDWYRVHPMPKGRMFEQETELAKRKAQ